MELNQINIQFLSDALAFLLLAVYIAGLIFTFFTHKHLFTTRLVNQDVNRIVIKEKNNNIEENPQQLEIHKEWSKKKSFILMEYSRRKYIHEIILNVQTSTFHFVLDNIVPHI
jgi:Ca2+:H+ antiporter